MSIVADRGLKKSQFTSARLKKGDVLYVETHSTRYVVCSTQIHEKSICVFYLSKYQFFLNLEYGI